ncbi:MAG TPA: toll/interleukin-1 receptor domain-containing protein [Xanthobacteraceae bacterium]|nr:toll/interleukin-1 receptor domain-containing protein [Xanthobacteraceae bacterium]
MKGNNPPPFLRVIRPAPLHKPIQQDDFRGAPWQQTLFSLPLPNLILFIHFNAVTESDFLAAIVNARPKYVLDLRVAPRFDIGTLNRRLVFSVFQQIGTQYYDVAGKLGVRSPRDAKLNPALLIDELRTMVFRDKQRVEGPIAFLVGDQQSHEIYENALARHLDILAEQGWEVLRVPHEIAEKRPESPRDLIFISHASPEDNDFARWVGTHLSSLGYRVWSDVTRLIGGEEFWDNIEEAIREHSAKVVVCLSHVSQTKKGVLDEIAWAVGTERSRGLENFVIPVRLDDLPFTDVRANLGRKNIIDFSGNWATGLAELVKALDRDGVPRPLEDGPGAVALMSSLRRRSRSVVVAQPEKVFANWLSIVSYPDTITFVEFDGSIREEHRIRQMIDRPTFGYLRLIGSYAHLGEIQACLPPAVRVTQRCTVGTSEFLHGRTPELPGLAPKEARNLLTSLLRQGWENRAKSMGLQGYQTSVGAKAWYLPAGLIRDNVVQFIGPEGQRRRRSLVGWSEKRRVHWHFAVEGVPVLTNYQRFVLRPHVVFTEDGRTPIESSARMHALRRGFCKSWWNDRWRDLIAAFASWLAQGQETMAIKMSDTTCVELHARLMEITAPVGLRFPDASPLASESDIADPDWADDPELDDSEIDPHGEIIEGYDVNDGR